MIMISTHKTAMPGDRIFEVEWQILRPAAAVLDNDDIDVDRDLETRVSAFKTKDAAIKAARQIWAETDLYWGVVTVTELVAIQSPNDPRVGDWEPIGESIEISE